MIELTAGAEPTDAEIAMRHEVTRLTETMKTLQAELRIVREDRAASLAAVPSTPLGRWAATAEHRRGVVVAARPGDIVGRVIAQCVGSAAIR